MWEHISQCIVSKQYVGKYVPTFLFISAVAVILHQIQLQ